MRELKIALLIAIGFLFLNNGIFVNGTPELNSTTPERAKAIFGADFIGPDEIFNCYSFRPAIPPVPFSESKLQEFKKRNMMLVYQVDSTPDGKPLTIKKMIELSEFPVPEIIYGSGGEPREKLLSLKTGTPTVAQAHFTAGTDENFYKAEVPLRGWKIVSRNIIAETVSKNYINQAAVLASFLKDSVYEIMGKEYHKFYAKAIRRLKSQKQKFQKALDNDWQKPAEGLTELEFNQLFRETASEVIYRTLICNANHQKILCKNFVATKSHLNDGWIIYIKGMDGHNCSADIWIGKFFAGAALQEAGSTINIYPILETK